MNIFSTPAPSNDKAEIERLRTELHRLQTENLEMRSALDKLTKRAYLLDIRRAGRIIHMTFLVDNERFEIETYGTMSDDVDGWRKKLCS